MHPRLCNENEGNRMCDFDENAPRPKYRTSPSQTNATASLSETQNAQYFDNAIFASSVVQAMPR
jgi:hypothetical protein